MSNPAPNVAITVPSHLTDEMKCEGVRSLRHNVNRPWEIAIEFAYEAMLAASPQPSDERVLPDRCPGCHLNWRMFPPVNHDDLVVGLNGKTTFSPTNGYRCVECKRDYRTALAISRSRESAIRVEAMQAERIKYAWLRSEAILRGAFESGIAIDAAYSARSLAQPKPECTDSDGEQT